MAFRASAGRITVTDNDGHLTFDSDEKLFNGTDFVAGTLVIPQRQATFEGNDDGADDNYLNFSVDHVLGAVNGAADTVLGSFRVATATNQGVANLGWFCASGTYVHYWGAIGYPTRPNEHWWNDNRVTYTFVPSGGTLVLRERVFLRSQGYINRVDSSLTVYAVTLDYKLYVGTFT
jgi:hypothetical protein